MAARRVLLVEDSSTMRRMLAMKLKEEGYDVKTANDGVDGLAKAREEPRPELILSDYEMPEMDGAELCKEIKKDKELRTIPVLMLTTPGRDARTRSPGWRRGRTTTSRSPRARMKSRRCSPGSGPRCGPRTSRPSWPIAIACWKRPTRS